MTDTLSKLLRKVFFSSLAGILASNASATNNTLVLQSVQDENKIESIANKNNDLSPKLLLKKTRSDDWTFMSHRSHRSHSSHRSHYSSYSGGGSGTSTTPKSNQGIKPGENSSGSSTKPNTSTTTLQLGARTLKKGMSGTDVTELINILLKKKYLKLDDGGTQVTGVYTYDETLEEVVKKFQTDNGLTSDGICNSTTIYYLKNK